MAAVIFFYASLKFEKVRTTSHYHSHPSIISLVDLSRKAKA